MQPTLVRQLRLVIGWVLAALTGCAMWMSWGALFEVAVALGGMPEERAFFFPIVIDLVTISAMLIAILGGRRGQWVAWSTLIVFGALTIAGNAAHVATVSPSKLGMGLVVGIAVNSVPGIALLMVTHLSAVTVFAAHHETATTKRTARAPWRARLRAWWARVLRRPLATTPTTAAPITTAPTAATTTATVVSETPAAREAPARSPWGEEHRTAVLALAADRLSTSAIAKRTGVPRSTVARWVAAP